VILDEYLQFVYKIHTIFVFRCRKKRRIRKKTCNLYGQSGTIRNEEYGRKKVDDVS